MDRHDEDFEHFPGLYWLEYQARLVAGALRPQDKCYVPYVVLKAKSEWGRRVLQVCEPGKYNEIDDEDLSEAPWLVCEKAEKSCANFRMALQLIAQLENRQQP